MILKAQKDLKASTTAAIQAKSDETAAQKAESEAKIQLVNQKKAEDLVWLIIIIIIICY